MNQKDYFRIIKGIIILSIVFMSINVYAADIQPVTNNGKKWRIGYLEGGPYFNYQSILKDMIESLMHSGWIEKAPIPECKSEGNTRCLWEFLATKTYSNYLEFSLNNYWSFNWEDATRKKQTPVVIGRLKNQKGIDLMLAFGTWAGQDIANDLHNTPTMVLSASNAIKSGIIKSVDDSGFDHVHVWIDPDKTKRQIKLFHEIAGFKKLGVAYENDSDGRSYAGIDDILELSGELGFKVVDCLMPVASGFEQETDELIKCHEKLAPQIDAMYITDYVGLTEKSISQLLTPLFKYKVPMFAQTRYDLVKYGIMIGTGRADFRADAEFYTNIFARILHGEKPRALPQKFESQLDIVINLESAQKIGLRIPLEILAGAFEIHEKIQKQPND